jgi:hypothetical protein
MTRRRITVTVKAVICSSINYYRENSIYCYQAILNSSTQTTPVTVPMPLLEEALRLQHRFEGTDMILFVVTPKDIKRINKRLNKEQVLNNES